MLLDAAAKAEGVDVVALSSDPPSDREAFTPLLNPTEL
jgi:hypothetical protein